MTMLLQDAPHENLTTIGAFIVLVGAFLVKVVTDWLDRRARIKAEQLAIAERLEAKKVVDATAVAVGVVTTNLAENTAITVDTHSIADGRLTAALKELSDSKADTAKLVSAGVAQAAADLLAKAQVTGRETIAQAEVAGVGVVDRARIAAEALLEQAAAKAIAKLEDAARGRRR